MLLDQNIVSIVLTIAQCHNFKPVVAKRRKESTGGQENRNKTKNRPGGVQHHDDGHFP